MKISFLLVTLGCLPAVALAAPTPTPGPSVTAANQVKAVDFLDGVAASYRKLHSLSATWHGIGGYDHKQDKWRADYKSQGMLAWSNSKPGQVRYEDKTQPFLFISSGLHHLTRYKGNQGDEVAPVDKDAVYEFSSIYCDRLESYLLNGKNPLKGSDFHGARLLGIGTVNGVRCRGVEFKSEEDEFDSNRSLIVITHIYTAWFDSRNLLRRYQEVTVELKMKESVDFEVHPNVKLSPTLFVISK